MNATKLVTAFSLSMQIACATNSYKRIEAEPLSLNKSIDGSTPKGIVEDAMRLEESFPLFDKVTHSKIENSIKSQKSKAQVQEEVRDAICDGNKQRVKSEVTVRLVIPKAPAGESLEEVSKKRQDFIKLARLYLKNWYLNDSSNIELLAREYDTDFEAYHNNMVVTDMQRKFAQGRVSVLIPFIPGSTRGDVEKYFSTVKVVPTVSPMHLDPSQWFPARHFISVNFPEQHYAILAPKVFNALVGAWGYQSGGTELEMSLFKDLQITEATHINFVTDEQTFTLRNSSNYTMSKNSWRLKDGITVRPLVQSLMDDLSFLKANFSFSIPREEVQKLFNVGNQTEFQYFGFNGEVFSPTLALQHQGYMWKRILENQTEVSEASQEDGGILFNLKPSFEIFCRYAIPTGSLASN